MTDNLYAARVNLVVAIRTQGWFLVPSSTST